MKYTTLLAACLFIFGCNHVKSKPAEAEIEKPLYFNADTLHFMYLGKDSVGMPIYLADSFYHCPGMIGEMKEAKQYSKLIDKYRKWYANKFLEKYVSEEGGLTLYSNDITTGKIKMDTAGFTTVSNDSVVYSFTDTSNYTPLNFRPSVVRLRQAFYSQQSEGVTYNDFYDSLGNFFRVTSKGEIRVEGDTIALMKNMLSYMIDYITKRTVMISDRGDTTRWSVYDTIRLITCKEK